MLTYFFASLLLAQASGHQPPVAIILEIRGKPQRTVAGQAMPALRLDLLRPGERVTTGSEESVTLLFVGDGHRERLDSNSALTIGEDKGMPMGSIEQLPSLLGEPDLRIVRDRVRSGKLGGTVFRSVEFGTPPAIAPVDEAFVASDRPVLRWPAKPDAVKYRLVLQTGVEKKRKEIANEVISKTEWTLLKDAPPLARNQVYRWKVFSQNRDGKETLHITEQRFTVGSADLEKQASAFAELAKADAPTNLLLGILGLESLHLLDELYPLYAKLAKQVNDDPILWGKAAHYAAKAGLPNEAAAARQKVQELGKK